MNADSGAWLDVRGAATHTRVSETTILRAARRGTLRAYKIAGGKLWRFRREDLDAWIERGAQPIVYSPRRVTAAG